MTQPWHNWVCIMAFYKFAKHRWLFQMLAMAIFISWLNSNSTGWPFYQNIGCFTGKHTSGRLWTILYLWAQIFSPTDVGSPWDKFKPSDNRFHIFWLLTLYQWDLMGCRLKAADLNINQINSAEGFVILWEEELSPCRCREEGSRVLTCVVMGWLWEASYQDFLVQRSSGMQGWGITSPQEYQVRTAPGSPSPTTTGLHQAFLRPGITPELCGHR